MSDNEPSDQEGISQPQGPTGDAGTPPPATGGTAGPAAGSPQAPPTASDAGTSGPEPPRTDPGGTWPPAEPPGGGWWAPTGEVGQEAGSMGRRPGGDPPTWPGGGPGYGPYGYGGHGPYGYGGWGAGWPPPPGAGWGPPGGSGPAGHPGGHRAGRRLLAAGLALVTAVAVLLGVGIGYTVWSSAATPSSSSSPSAPRFGIGGTTATGRTGSRSSAAAGSPSNISAIAAKVDPELVDINTVLGYQTGQAAGTGMVLTSSGEVLTNNHVIEGATKISATDLGNGRTYTAHVVGYDRTLDVAVIQLQGASGLQTVSTSSAAVAVGEAVVGIGNAGGTGGTPATAGGSVVALNQSITASDQADSTTEHLTGLIETNAHIEAGDSGGPLVDSSGKVIGMDTAASAAQGFTFRGATGDGYAIPITTALATARQIVAGKGSPTIHIGATAFLGVAVEKVGQATLTTRTGLGEPGLGNPTRFFGTGTTGSSSNGNLPSTGAYVHQVITGTPAQKAGLARGDVITRLGGTAVTSPSSLSDALIPYHPGDTVSVQWTDTSGQQHSATVQLAAGPAA